MKNLSLLFILTLFAILPEGYSQCKYKGVPGKLRRYCVSDTKPNPDKATNLSVLFDRYYFVGQVGFARAGTQHYLYLHLARNMSKAFQLHSTNPLKLTTKSGKEVVIYPAGDYSGKNMLTWYAVGCYYQLSKEQLEVLATDKVETVQLYVSSENEIQTTPDGGGDGWLKDQNGQVFFRHTIDAEGKKEKCRKAADCLLNSR